VESTPMTVAGCVIVKSLVGDWGFRVKTDSLIANMSVNTMF